MRNRSNQEDKDPNHQTTLKTNKMKPLNKMNNVEKGRLLADLFPEQLENICNALAQQAEYFLKNEEHLKKTWVQTLITEGFWFELVRNAEKRAEKYGTKLHKNHRWFADQLFDGYDAVFTIYCLVEYASKAECDYKLRYAIYMLFSSEKLVLSNTKQQ